MVAAAASTIRPRSPVQTRPVARQSRVAPTKALKIMLSNGRDGAAVAAMQMIRQTARRSSGNGKVTRRPPAAP
jgi:hypothetical protein